jgi:exopolysaccharide biosynthesis operon protein EpsL
VKITPNVSSIQRRSRKLVTAFFFFTVFLSYSTEVFAVADSTDVWQISLLESFGYDNNLFRLSNRASPALFLTSGSTKSDFINKLSAGAGINHQFGRQKLLVNLNIDDNRFFNNGFLNNQSTDDKLILKWVVGKFFSGDVGYTYKRYMGGFTNTNFFKKDLIDEQSALVNGAYAFHPSWIIRTGGRWFNASHSAEARNVLDLQSFTGSLGLDYLTSLKNTMGLEYRISEGDLPNRSLLDPRKIDNHYVEQSISTVVKWRLLRKTSLDARIGYTDREYPNFAFRSFSGETWRISLNWEPTATTMFSLSGWHDLLSWSDVNASYVVSEGVSLSPAWTITSKVILSGRFSWETRSYTGDGDLVLRTSAQRQDDILGGQVALRYQPIQSGEIGLFYQAEERMSTQPFSDYTYSSVFASASLKF